MRSFVLSVFLLSIMACNSPDKVSDQSSTADDQAITGVDIQSVENNYNHDALVVPEGAVVDILFKGAIDSVVDEAGDHYLSKNNHDFIAYIPKEGSSTHGYLFVNHELRIGNDLLGDGGGMSWFEVEQIDGHWQVISDFKHIDFSGVGGTWHNCGGVVTPHNTILTAEEYPPHSNLELYHGGEHYSDTSDFNGMKRNEALGWMVEVDASSGKVMHKLISMGRYSHEDAWCAEDGKTVYLTDDYKPAIFFKFVADNPGDYTKGDLFAYKQSYDGESGEWVKLPSDTPSLINIRQVAIEHGASMLSSTEWVEGVDGKIYITESGGDFDYIEYVSQRGTIPSYFRSEPFWQGDNKVKDPYGRILVFDPQTNKLSVHLEGGIMPDSGIFARPDGMTATMLNGKPYMVVCEDGGWDKTPKHTEAYEKKEHYNESFLLDLSIEDPSLEDLVRLSVCPKGCEQTGPYFTPDGKTMFISVQHPSSDNPAPYNTSLVIAVSGIFE